ncbi:MAG: apolipoprotein N-acyltransferase [Pseudomonadota bacterium]
MPARLRISGAILAGLCLTGSQAPFSFWPLLPVGVMAAMWLFRQAGTPKAAGWAGWVIGTAYFAASMTWIVEPFFVDAARHGWMAPFALGTMAGGLALFWAAAFWAARRFGTAWSLVALWPLAEFARGTVFTGFPWGLLAYGWLDTPIAQSVAWIGPYGLTAVTFGLCAVPVFWRPALGSVVLVGGLGLLTALGLWDRSREPVALPDAPVIRLTQPNAPQHLKWDPAYIPTFFQRLIAYTEASPRADLIVWPETSVPNWLNRADEVLAHISEAAEDTPVVFGIQRFEGADVFNTAGVLSPDGEVLQVYDKHHLVPFGEYLPLQGLASWLGLVALADLNGGGFAPGPGPVLLDLPGIGLALPLICYEAVFPQYARAGAQRPALLLHLTNDAWFGTRSGPQQHLVQARFRAMETGLPLLRSANTGISAVIDARGDVRDQIGLGTMGYIDASLPPARAATAYARGGDLPVFLALIVLLFVTLLPYRAKSD